jgi:hypothetical protein
MSTNKYAGIEYADAQGFLQPIDVYKMEKKKSEPRASIEAVEKAGLLLDFHTWLPFASQKYQISSNPRDYVLIPAISIPSGLPNRNGVAFPLDSLTEFNTEHGCQAYKTFVGKPMFIEHQNADYTKAIGVVADAALRPMTGFGNGRVWKLLKLAAVDRNKGYEVAPRLLDKTLNTFSMGSYVGRYTCGCCGATMGQCSHINKRNAKDFYVLDGKLVFRQVHDIVGFEYSVVTDPAFLSAAGHSLITI